MLLDQINTPFVRSNPSVLQGLLRIIPYLSFGELEKMRILVERFKPCCNFDKWASFSFHIQPNTYLKLDNVQVFKWTETLPAITKSCYTVVKLWWSFLTNLCHSKNLTSSECCSLWQGSTDPCLYFLRYDEEHSADDKVFLDCFCKIAAGIKNNSNGHQLKDLILQKGITQSALDYMKKHIPNAKK